MGEAAVANELAIVGCGTMGEAILSALLGTQTLAPERMVATVRRSDAAKKLQRDFNVTVLLDNVEACARSHTVIVALKPQRMRDILDTDAMRTALAGKLLVSIAAGTRSEDLARWLPNTTIVRAMPNTPCLVRAGMTVLAPGPRATEGDVARARALFEPMGRVMELQEKHMDAVTSLNGSGPAFAYVMLEAMADGGVMMGLPRDAALEIAATVFMGAASMVLQTGTHPAALKDQVTTPAGSTIAGLLVMEDGRIRSVLARAIQEATNIASSLGGPTSAT